MLVATKCQNCQHCIKTKTLSGMSYKCSKTNKKVNKDYYCGKVKPLQLK